MSFLQIKKDFFQWKIISCSAFYFADAKRFFLPENIRQAIGGGSRYVPIKRLVERPFYRSEKGFLSPQNKVNHLFQQGKSPLE